MRDCLRWPERTSVSDWVDRNIVLGSDSSDPGPIRTSRTPYVREWQDSAALPWVHQVTIQKSTQVGGSVALLNVLAYAIAQDPGPAMWVMPTREDAAEVGENRVQPMIDLCAALRKQLTEDRFDAKKRQIKFRRCRLLFRSAGVPKELAQYATRWLFCDEAGKWPDWTKDEAAPFDLARERTRTFWNHKIYLSSTPKRAEGLITTEFAAGDRRRYHVPCPHCHKFQVLRWQQVKWPPVITTLEQLLASKAAWYDCEHCKQPIDDLAKAPMLAAGWWCPEDIDPAQHLVDGRLVLPNDRASHRSYHLWAGYSPWLSWLEIAAQWFRSKDTPKSLQNFVNSWLGEPWVEKVEDPKPQALQACVAPYRRGAVPDGVQVITAGVDVQKRHLVFSLRGWGVDGQSWLLDHGTVDSWERLGETLFRRSWPRALMVRAVFVDGRYRTPEAVEFARKWPQVRLSFGVERDDPRPFTSSRMDRNPNSGIPLGSSLVVWHVNTGMFKDVLAQQIRDAAKWHIYEDADGDYLKEMTSEHKILQRSRDRVRERWVLKPGHQQNHYWDTEVLNVAIAELLQVHKLREFQARAAARRRPMTASDEFEESPLWRRST